MSDERYFCVHCQDADVQRSDEDLCCLMCGVDLVALADLQTLMNSAGFALVSAADVPTPEERAVLDAMAAETIIDLECVIEGEADEQPCVAACKAELARRAAKDRVT